MNPLLLTLCDAVSKIYVGFAYGLGVGIALALLDKFYLSKTK